MIFVLLTFLAAFLIEGLGTAVSVIGLSTLFGANPIIIALAIALDLGKLVVVSLLYKYWDKLGKIMRSYALIAALVTMVITSAGAAGYLSGEFQKAIIGTQETSLKVDVLKKQQMKYEERKKQIDDQIAHLPEKTSVNQRIRMINAFKAEQAELQVKINEIDKQLPDLQIHQISVEAKAGPILYIAKAFDIPVESAVKWVILMIIFVFDPLAVFLIIAGNFLLHQHSTHKNSKIVQENLLEKFDSAKHSGEFPQSEQPSPELDRAFRYAKTFGAPEIPDPDYVPEVMGSYDDGADRWTTDHARNLDTQDLSDHMVKDHISPIFEVLQPTSDVVEKPTAKESDVEIAPQRPQIRLEDLRPVHRSSLNDARADAIVTFDQNPQDSRTTKFYKG